MNFDLIIIGTGSAGQSAAYPMASAGWKVAIVDEYPFGGTCALRGCDPKKVLVGAAEAIDWMERLNEVGVASAGARINWKNLAKFKKTFIENTPGDTEKGLKEAGVKTFHGTAVFLDKNTLTVNGKTLKAKHFLIATGSTPVKLNIPGEEFVSISDDFLDLGNLPKKIIFIGGGYISFEFAHIAKRAGAEMTILHRSERVLSGFDPDLVDLLLKASEDLGIRVEVNSPAMAVEKKGEGLFVHTKTKVFEADLVVHGGGRIPNLKRLNLEKAGVEYSSKGVRVNEYLESSTRNIFAAGDASDYGLPLTPVAGKEGALVAHNLLNPEKKKAKFSEMPSVVFTIPPLASVGLREDEAREKGLDFDVNFSQTSSWYSSRRINEKYSGYKTLVEKKTGRILGAHLLGHGSDEVINLFAIAIAKNLTADDLKDFIYSYPSESSDIEYMV